MKLRRPLFMIFVFAVFIAALLLTSLLTSGIADAVLPQTYLESVEDAGLEWWTGEQYLNIPAVKEVVDSWSSNPIYRRLNDIKSDPVVVAVIDSGIFLDNELFSGKYDENGVKTADGGYDVLLRDADGKLISQNTVGERNATSPNPVVTDDASNKHGTHVAGIVALLIHMFDLEDYIKILPIKAGSWDSSSNNVRFQAADFREALTFAMQHGADVVNMSVETSSSSWGDMITDAYAEQAIFVAAAGNSGMAADQSNTSNWVYPAASKNVIGVMNYQEGLTLSSRSNYGNAYQLCAPGTGIYSSKGGEGVFDSSSGTSMATPVVAFTAALALVKYRAMALDMTVAQIKQEVLDAHTRTIQKGKYIMPVLDLMELAVGKDDFYGIAIIEDGSETQVLGRTQPIKYSFNINPSEYNGLGTVEWYADDKKVGEGFEFTYTPADRYGKTVLRAEWRYENNKLSFSTEVFVDYIQITTEEISKLSIAFLDSDGNECTPTAIKSGESCMVTIKGAYTISPDRLVNVMWYVNNKLSGNGASFEFTPSEVGTYVISFKIGSHRSGNFSLTVAMAGKDTNKILEYVAYAAGGAAALAAIIVLIVILARRSASQNARRRKRRR